MSVAYCFDVYNEVRILFFGCHCRFDECGKYRVGDFGTRCKFGVELYAHEEGVIAHFNGFDDTTVGGFAAYHEAAFFKRFEIVRVELVSVAVSFFDDVLICVGFFDFRAVFEGAGVCAEAHRSADSLALFVGKNVDDVTAAFGKLAARCVLDAEYVTGVFDDGDVADYSKKVSDPEIKATLIKNADAYAVSQYFRMGSTDVQVRTSGYAKFADTQIDKKILDGAAVNMKGIITVYKNAVQFTLIDLNGVEITTK